MNNDCICLESVEEKNRVILPCTYGHLMHMTCYSEYLFARSIVKCHLCQEIIYERPT